MQDLLLLDVTPLPMGFATGYGVMTKPIELIKFSEDERRRPRVTTFSVSSMDGTRPAPQRLAKIEQPTTSMPATPLT